MDFVSWPQRLSKEQADLRRDVCTGIELRKLTASKEFQTYVKGGKKQSLSRWSLLGSCLAFLLLGALASQAWKSAPFINHEVPQATTEIGTELQHSEIQDAEGNEWFANMKLRESENRVLPYEQKIKELEDQIKRNLEGSAWFDSYRSKELQKAPKPPRSTQSLSSDIDTRSNATRFQEQIADFEPVSNIPEDLAKLTISSSKTSESEDQDRASTAEDTWGPVCAVLLIILAFTVSWIGVLRSSFKLQSKKISLLQQDQVPLLAKVSRLEEAERQLTMDLRNSREQSEAILNEAIQAHAQEIEVFEGMVNGSSLQAAEMQSHLRQSLRESDKMRRESKALQADIADLKETVGINAQRMQSLKSENANMQAKVQASSETQAAKQAEIEKLQAEVQVTLDAHVAMQAEVVDLANTLRDSSGALKAKEAEVQALHKCIEGLHKSLQESSEDQEAKQVEIEQLQNALKDSSDARKAKEDMIEELQMALQNSSDFQIAQQDEVQKLLRVVKSLSDAQEVKQAEVNELRKSLQDSRDAQMAKQSEIQALHRSLQAEKQEQNSLAAECDAFADQNDSLVLDLAAANAKNAELAQELDGTSQKLACTESKAAELQMANRELSTKPKSLDQKEADFVSSRNEAEAETLRLQQIEQQESQMQTVDQLLQDVIATESKNKVLQIAHADAQKELSDLRAEKELKDQLLKSMGAQLDETSSSDDGTSESGSESEDADSSLDNAASSTASQFDLSADGSPSVTGACADFIPLPSPSANSAITQDGTPEAQNTEDTAGELSCSKDILAPQSSINLEANSMLGTQDLATDQAIARTPASSYHTPLGRATVFHNAYYDPDEEGVGLQMFARQLDGQGPPLRTPRDANGQASLLLQDGDSIQPFPGRRLVARKHRQPAALVQEPEPFAQRMMRSFEDAGNLVDAVNLEMLLLNQTHMLNYIKQVADPAHQKMITHWEKSLRDQQERFRSSTGVREIA